MNRSTTILLAVLVLLTVVTYIVMQRPGEQSSTGTLGTTLVQYDSAAVDRLEVTSSSGSVTLVREGGTWQITEPIRARADEKAVTNAVGTGARIELKTVVSSNPEKRSMFQVDSTGTLVRVFERGVEAAAFRIGKTGASYTETYVRKEGGNDVYLATGLLTYAFNRQLREWRNRNLVTLDLTAVESVRFQYGDTTFVLALQDSLWRVDGEPTVSSAVQGFLTSLTSLQADDFIDSAVVSPPPLVALLDVAGTQIRFFQKPGEQTYIVQRSDAPQLYTMQSWRASPVLKRKRDFLPPAS